MKMASRGRQGQAKAKDAARGPLAIGGVQVFPGEHRTIDLRITDLSTHTPMTMPIQVIRGRRDGPRLFVCAALHGDEISGVEIIRQIGRAHV